MEELKDHNVAQRLAHHLSSSCTTVNCIRGHVGIFHGTQNGDKIDKWCEEHEHPEDKP